LNKLTLHTTNLYPMTPEIQVTLIS